MSTPFNEALHPRGQAANAGQFIAKSNDAPAGSLTPADKSAHLDAIAHGHSRAEWAARIELLQWERRVREASVEQFLALAGQHAPSGATHALFSADGDDVSLVGWQSLAGERLHDQPMDGHDLEGFDLSDGDQLRDAGFKLDTESWLWELELREPTAPRSLADGAERWGTEAHRVDARANGDGALGAFLAGVTRRAPLVGEKLATLTDRQVASLNRDVEAFASLIATKILADQEA